MARFVIGIGSNVSDKVDSIKDAFAWLSDISEDFIASEIYITKALNGIDDDYANAVCSCSLDQSLQDFNLLLKQYEKSRGRTPESKITGLIPIDLDIVIYNGEIVRQKDYIREYFQKGWKMIDK